MIKYYFIFVSLGSIVVGYLIFLENKKKFTVFKRNFLAVFSRIAKYFDNLDSYLDRMVMNYFRSFQEKAKIKFFESKLVNVVPNLKPYGLSDENSYHRFRKISTMQVMNDDIDLQERYTKLENILQEKSVELELINKAFLSEKKNREDFEIVRNLLASQIDQDKQKSHHLQNNLNLVQSENQELQQRIVDLLEQLSQKEKKIDECQKNTISLLQQMQILNSKLSKRESQKPIQDAEFHNGESLSKSF